eukprot:364307-Chlamydomonas_euryale.AAC.3
MSSCLRGPHKASVLCPTDMGRDGDGAEWGWTGRSEAGVGCGGAYQGAEDRNGEEWVQSAKGWDPQALTRAREHVEKWRGDR